MLQFMGSKRVGYHSATEQQQQFWVREHPPCVHLWLVSLQEGTWDTSTLRITQCDKRQRLERCWKETLYEITSLMLLWYRGRDEYVCTHVWLSSCVCVFVCPGGLEEVPCYSFCPWLWCSLWAEGCLQPPRWRKASWEGHRDTEAWAEQISRVFKIQTSGPNLQSSDPYRFPQVVMGPQELFLIFLYA